MKEHQKLTSHVLIKALIPPRALFKGGSASADSVAISSTFRLAFIADCAMLLEAGFRTPGSSSGTAGSDWGNDEARGSISGDLEVPRELRLPGRWAESEARLRAKIFGRG
jgi:hypothetical protein